MRRTFLSLAALTLLITAPAAADELHFETFRYGQRALGMGGAVVALPGEPEASWYNPAGLAMLEGAIFSGALQFYGLDQRNLRRSFRAGGWFAPQDEASDAFVALPSSSVITKAFGDEDQHVFAFSTFLVDHTVEGFASSITTPLDVAPFQQIQYASTRSLDDNIIFIGGSWAWRARPDLSVGASLLYARRDERRSQQRTEVLSTASSDLFLVATNASTLSDGALLARLGAIWRPQAALSLGLACTTPSVRLHGEGRVSFGITSSGDPEDPELPPILLNEVQDGVETTTAYPVNCRTGVAWQPRPNLLLAADLSLALPNSYERLRLDAATRRDFNVDAQLLIPQRSQLTPNAALGLEYRPSPRWPLRAGLFTNRSAAPDIPDRPTALYAPQVHLYGATLSGGFVGDDRSINLGAEVQWGQGHDVVVQDIGDLLGDPTFLRVDREQLRVLFFVSGAFDFAKKSATDLLGIEEETPPAP